MFTSREWNEICIERIVVAHRFVLDGSHRCEYPKGRGVYGLVYCISGAVEYRFSNGEICPITTGDLLLLAPTAAYTIAVEQEFQHYTVNFVLDNAHPERLYCPLHLASGEVYLPLLRKLCTAWLAKGIGDELRATGLLYELMAQFVLDMHHSSHGTAAHRRLLPAKHHIEQSPCDATDLTQLAHLCDMSVTHFRREWGRLYGQTPMQYRDRMRLSRAKEFLASGYYTVSEVAMRCGFEDVSYFVRFFKRHTGISPGKFKQEDMHRA